MAGQPEINNLALFCDFENIALGVRESRYANFDIRRVLERLLLKGSIVVKKAYCDWDRYKDFKRPMHEASFELIEIPHVRQSGKNSADIRMVVDALDLCYTKAHVDAFVIISGDSDFSPLVSKLRENNKYVIGIGVRDSTSDLLAANCDEFIFYDDLVRETAAKKSRTRRSTPSKAGDAPSRSADAPSRSADATSRRADAASKSSDVVTKTADVPSSTADVPPNTADGTSNMADGTSNAADVASESADATSKTAQPRSRRTGKPSSKTAEKSAPPARKRRGAKSDAPSATQATPPVEAESTNEPSDVHETGDSVEDDRRQDALDLLVETIEALAQERGDDDKLWGSMVKQTMKRRRPGFNEASYGYRSFRELVDDAASRHLLDVISDARPGQYALRLPRP